MILSSFFFIFWSFYYGVFNPVDLMCPDSQGYIDFDYTRTVGYPIFLWIIQKCFGSLQFVPYIQLFLNTWGVGLLASRIKKLTTWSWAGAFVVIGCLGNPEWMTCHARIMSESLTHTLLCFLIADMVLAASSVSSKLMFRIGLWVGLALLIRPTSALWVFGIAVMVCVMRHVRFKKLVQCMLPILCLYVFGNGVFYLHHGHFKSHAMTGHNMIGKLGILATPTTPSTDPNFMNALSKAAQTDVIQGSLKQCQTMGGYGLLSSAFYDDIRFDKIQKAISQLPTDLQNQLKDPFFYDNYMTKRSKDILSHHVPEYLMDSFKTYVELWLLPHLKSSDHLKDVAQVLDVYPQLKNNWAVKGWMTEHFRKSLPDSVIKGLRLCIILFYIASICLLFHMICQIIKRRHLSPAALSFLGTYTILQCTYIAIAMTQAPLLRYAIVMWPCLFVCTVLGLKYINENIKNVKG